VHYFTDLDSAHANFIVEIRDDENSLLWDTQLKNTNSSVKKSLYVLPDDVSGKQANLGIRMDTKDKGVHTLTFKKMSLYINQPT
jgi:hypothetical protein